MRETMTEVEKGPSKNELKKLAKKAEKKAAKEAKSVIEVPVPAVPSSTVQTSTILPKYDSTMNPPTQSACELSFCSLLYVYDYAVNVIATLRSQRYRNAYVIHTLYIYLSMQ